jgi:hypothetical protein
MSYWDFLAKGLGVVNHPDGVNRDSAPEAGIHVKCVAGDFFGGAEPDHDPPPPV